MKKFTLVLLLVSVAFSFFGCKKKTDTGNPTSLSSPLVYTVNGLSDVTVPQYADTTVDVVVVVAHQSGTQEAVKLTPTDLPAGFTVIPATGSGTPSFSTKFSFHVNTAVSGTFPITITSGSATTETKTFKFNLIVSPGLPFSYGVSGITDITVPQFADTTIVLPVNITYIQGLKESVVVTSESTNPGITITPASTTGTPPFSSSYTLHIKKNVPGSFPVTIKTASASTTTQTHSFNVIVSPVTNCTSVATGTYTENTVCASFSGTGTGITTGVAITSTAANEISVPIGMFSVLTANLNCSNGTLTTQPKINVDFNIPAGNGTFTFDTIVVNYTLTGSLNTTCTSTYTR